MAVISVETLKTKFESGDWPRSADYMDLIDTLAALPEGGVGGGGNVLLNGSGNPSNETGSNGDFYINTVNYDIYGPKASGAWGSPVSLIGPQGATGAQGETGSTGPQGPTGEQGIQGETGATGATGTTGAQGETGPTGAQGPQGDPGTDALWNFTGAYGVGTAYAIGDVATYQGQTWYRINANGGNVGDTPAEGTFWTLIAQKGEVGATGATGDQGPQGIQGEQGIQGIQGETGLTGPQGEQGIQGIQGIQGETGATGATGPQGDTGPAGPGVATGGTTGQYLTKVDGTNYNTQWSTLDLSGKQDVVANVSSTEIGYLDGVTSAIQTQIDSKLSTSTAATTYAPLVLTQNQQTGTTYTFVLADAGKLVEFNNASAITVTVPTNNSVPYAIGTQINILQTGAGQVTVSAGSTTVNATPGLKLRAQWSSATLIKRNTDTWVLVGDLSS